MSLAECLTLHLNLPDILATSTTTSTDWTIRPLDKDRCRAAAKKVAFLGVLQSYLLHDRLLRSYYEQCTEFAGLNLVNVEAEDEAIFDLISTNNYGMDKLKPIDLASDDVVNALKEQLRVTSVSCSSQQ